MAEFTKERTIEELKASTQNASGMFEIGEETICNLMSMLTNAAPQLPQPAVPDISRLEDVLEWINGLPVPTKSATANYCRLKNFITDYRAAMLQGADGNPPVILDDVRRMDWLVSKTVDVREPMVYGSHSLFWSQTITDEDDDYHATKLREQIDAAMAAENAEAPQQEADNG